MIVKNEADRIERCLSSLAPHISHYVIVDTGSTDGTPDKIKKFFESSLITGEIHHVPFINFEQARNAALDAAKTSPLEFDYMLLCDADMVVVEKEAGWADKLTMDAYAVAQRAGTVVYSNIRIVKKTSIARYVGVTHEFLSVPEVGECTAIEFFDHADGANRVNKFERDIALLKEGLEKDPSNGRYWFYLAQSYKDSQLWGQAADAYKMRVSLGGWEEETWNAQVNYAHCLAALGNQNGFHAELLKAYDMRPSRPEAVYDLARDYRMKGKNVLATTFAMLGMSIPPTRDVLFVNEYAQKWGFREEFAIAGYYTQHRFAAGKVCDGLALDKTAPEGVKLGARWNLFHYIRPLSDYVDSFLEHKFPFATPNGYTPLNPSIVNMGGKLVSSVRTVNYTITESGHYQIKGGDGSINQDNPIDTETYIVHLDEDLTEKARFPIHHPANMPVHKYGLVRGFEDIRLFVRDGALRFSACVREMNEHGWCEQVVGRIDETNGHYQMSHLKQVLPEKREHEKNWAPLVTPNGQQFFMYRLDRKVSNNGVIEQIADLPIDVGHISGGSQYIHFNGGYLGVVHEAHILPGTERRYYFHRLAVLDKEFKLVKLTSPFVFRDRQIEFCSGLARHPDGNHLVFSYGIKDHEACFATAHVADVTRFIND
jgi:glycosyltransferase involved in cell wall biosynthesis